VESKAMIKAIVFILNFLFTTIMALTALWSPLPQLIYFFWVCIGVVSTIYFAFFFKKFSNWNEFIYKSLLHGAFIYFVLFIFIVIHAIILFLYELI
jgi:hypothetical protein